MKTTIKLLQSAVFVLLAVAFSHLEANAQGYLPFGPQTNVPVATVTGGGWTECYRDLYNNAINVNTVLSDCPGGRLMLSCRQTGSDTLTLLAQSLRSDVTFDTGNNQTSTHIANGVGWYFNDDGFPRSWGFARAGDSVSKENCDIRASGANDERLCWHVAQGLGGWRCGVTTGLTNSTAFERIVYMSTLSINLSPDTATNNVFTDHTVTAAVVIDGVPAEGVLVSFEVISGPNTGEASDPDSGECTPNDDCTTDASGQVSWTYSSELLGTDTIVASIEDAESNAVEKIWVITRNIPTLSEWGLIAMAGILGLVGLLAMRRRKAAA